ncbi:MAG: hypothetical protein Q7R41_09895, partial [Phycisphaerales bacterium]|nr:hypothetical protein [Phycisphaerales bacterium]
HRILDAAWDRESGQFDATALPDVVLEWDADASAMYRCRVSGPFATESGARGDECTHVAPATDFDLGSTDLRKYRAVGFRWNEAADSVSWNWVTRPRAEMLLPLPTDDDYLINIRGMSATANTVRVWLNGQVIGQHEIAGDFVWQEQVSVISRAQWRDAPYQSVVIEATEATDGLYVAIDRIWLEPIGPVASFDFGSIDLSSLRASGFRNNESDSTASWNWMIERDAELHLPLPARDGASVEIRAMSVVPSWLTVELNGNVLGHSQIPGNFRWVDVQFDAAPEKWVGSGPQRLSFRATDMRDGFFVAIDAIVVRYR